MSKLDLLRRASDLRSQRVPFVLATVIRAEKPTSAKPGDSAVILADGTIEGFVGGSCAESSVRVESLKALDRQLPTTLLISPGTEDSYVARPGEVSVSNPCLSGGTLEIFLEPTIPLPQLLVFGRAPIANAVADLATFVGFDASAVTDIGAISDSADAVVLASHGVDEEDALRAALKAGVRYIALVASAKRAAAVLDSLGIDESGRSRVHSPAGLDIGAKTPHEVALSILAEAISTRPKETESNADKETPKDLDLSIAVDPVCGMDVAVSPSSLQLELGDEVYYFCGSGCRIAFSANPDSYLKSDR